MEKEEFRILVKAMKAVYADPKFIPDQNAYDVWFAMLGDLPYETTHAALVKFMMTSKFPPTIADIRERATEIMHPDLQEMSELEAWSLVRKAVSNSNYHAEEEFEKLPEACKLAIGNSATLREWAVMDSDTLGSVEQSHFIRTYRATVERMKLDAKLPTDFRNRIAEIRNMALLGVTAPAM